MLDMFDSLIAYVRSKTSNRKRVIRNAGTINQVPARIEEFFE